MRPAGGAARPRERAVKAERGAGIAAAAPIEQISMLVGHSGTTTETIYRK
jgi:hypothetical protein